MRVVVRVSSALLGAGEADTAAGLKQAIDDEMVPVGWSGKDPRGGAADVGAILI